MKQLIFNNSQLEVAELYPPCIEDNQVLIAVEYTAISPATEKISLSTSSPQHLNLVKKLIQENKLSKAISQIQKYGLYQTWNQFNSLASSSKRFSGYSASGVVLAVGKYVSEFEQGDRVAAFGNQFAHHAEFISVPKSMIVHVPDSLSTYYASSVALGSISLQSVRQLKPSIGENILVVGLGAIGQLTLRLLNLNGTLVTCVDPNKGALEQANSYSRNTFGDLLDPNLSIYSKSLPSTGFDGAIIAASSSDSEIINNVSELMAKNGVIVISGDVPIEASRKRLYSKEISIKLSCSYGPGRYDRSYEDLSNVYPTSYIRWHQRENAFAFLQLLDGNVIKFASLFGEPIDINNILSPETNPYINRTSFLPIIQYPPSYKLPLQLPNRELIATSISQPNTSSLRIGLVGYGNFAKSTLIPSIQSIPYAKLVWISSSKVEIFDQLTTKFKDIVLTNNPEEIIKSSEVDAIVIATRHANHADLIIKCLENNKHVYVEKPLCINSAQLKAIGKSYEKISNLIVRVGFNRPFSSSIQFLMSELNSNRRSSGNTLPLSLNYIVNAKKVDPLSWLHHDGGRLIGEYCHMLDLVFFLIGKHPNACSSLKRTFMNHPSDCIQSIFRFSDNSLASISYLTDSSPSLDKEIITANLNGKTYILHDFCKLQIYDGEQKLTHKFAGKGHKECLNSFVDSCLDPLHCSNRLFEEQFATFECLFRLI